ncbi:MAG: rod shape-determining protein MreD [Bacteroidales bacterium]|nr:rod shape-determining protein MreD [Bacteroidales bacterium]
MIKYLPKYIILFISVVFVQIFLLNQVQFSGFLNPYLYILFILLLPFEILNSWLLLLAFLLGISIDLFSGTPGMHASASVFMAFARPYVLKIFAPREGYIPQSIPTIGYYGAKWFIKYALTLTFIHHAFLFFIEIGRFDFFFTTTLRIILSTIFTMILLLAVQLLFFKSKK